MSCLVPDCTGVRRRRLEDQSREEVGGQRSSPEEGLFCVGSRQRGTGELNAPGFPSHCMAFGQ